MTRDSTRRCFLASCALAAAVAPGLAVAQTAGTKPEPIGRLFFTPAQRAQLDIARRQRARATLATEQTEEVAQPVPQTITYDGVVRRSDGKTTVWINNRPIHDRAPAGGAAVVGRIGTDGSVVLQVPQTGRSVRLKPGQSIELLSGAVEEGYLRRAPEPKPAAKPAATDGAGKPRPAEVTRVGRDRETGQSVARGEAALGSPQGRGAATPGGAAAKPSGPAP